MTEKKKDERTKNWTFIQYDDSSAEDWRIKLDDLKVPWCESPLHDKDKNPDGSDKKPHRHIVMAFSSKKSFEQIQEISDLVSGVKPEKVANMRGMVRYLVHMDNPEKVKYSVGGIIAHSGFDVDAYIKASGRDRREIIKEMMEYIKENDICWFDEFCDYCYEKRFDDWSEIITDRNTLYIQKYIMARSQRKEHEIKILSETVEVSAARRARDKVWKKKMVHEAYYEDDEK